MRRHNSSLDDQSLWQVALDHARDAAIIIDDGGYICFFSQTAERFWGIGRAELIGCHCDRLGINAMLEPIAGSHHSNAASELTVEIEITSRDGR